MLFCLAVSDIVVINVRGNLDFNTERILRICYEKLEALNKMEEMKEILKKEQEIKKDNPIKRK